MSETLVNAPLLALNDGRQLPAIGFGTHRLRGEAGTEAISTAIRTGYRLLDAAVNDENEGTLGAAVRRSGTPRQDPFLSSKLPGRHHDYDSALDTIAESLFRTGVDYYDLYLIHWPNPRQDRYIDAWRALIEARRRGLLRSIGVCNFLPEHLERLRQETGMLPALNQIELHPYFPQDTQLAYHRTHGIVTQAWSPLGRKTRLLDEALLKTIAARHARSPAQIVLRWHVQHGSLPIPKSASAVRQRDNLRIFDFALSNEDMAGIARLARTDGRIAGQDPAQHEAF